MTTEESPEPSPRGRRRQLLIVSACALVIGGLLALFTIGLSANKTNTRIEQALEAGRPAPAAAFSMPLLVNPSALGRTNGSQLSLADLRGRPVVLNFWASWCVPCKREAPRLEAAWRRHRASGALVLGVDVQDLEEDGLAFIHRYGQTYPSVRDRNNKAYRDYGLTGVPETFFIDGEGMVRAHWIGEIYTRQLSDGFALLRSRRPPSGDAAPPVVSPSDLVRGRSR